LKGMKKELNKEQPLI